MAISQKQQAHRLADQMERSFRGGAWHGPAIAEVIEGIDAKKALHSEPPAAHSILDLVRHLSFWIRAAHDRIVGSNGFDAAADWPDLGAPAETSWSEAREALELAHTQLIAAVRELDDDRLDEALRGSAPSIRGLLLGILQHNAYHTGQIVEIARREPT